MERNGDEYWLSIDEAAGRLKVLPEALHARIARGHIETRSIAAGDRGQHVPHIRKSDVKRMRKDGLPHPQLEKHLAGDVVPVPDEWLVFTRSDASYGPSAFVALVPMLHGPSRRQLLPGDVFGADDGPVSENAILRGDIAELPVRYGVLALVRVLQARCERLEAELAKASA